MERDHDDMLIRMGMGEYEDGESQDEDEESTRGSSFGIDTDEENRMLDNASDGGSNMEE